jgi:hypothetical protein
VTRLRPSQNYLITRLTQQFGGGNPKKIFARNVWSRGVESAGWWGWRVPARREASWALDDVAEIKPKGED